MGERTSPPPIIIYLMCGIRTHDLTRITLKSYTLPQEVVLVDAWSLCNFIKKKLKIKIFCKKSSDYDKISIRNIAKIA